MSRAALLTACLVVAAGAAGTAAGAGVYRGDVYVVALLALFVALSLARHPRGR